MRFSMSDVRRSKIVSAPAPCIGSCSRDLVETNDDFKRSAGVAEKPAEGPTPLLFAVEHLETQLFFCARVIYCLSSVMLAVFTRIVFRPTETWASVLVGVLQLSTFLVSLAQYAEYEVTGVWSTWSDSTLGVLEMVTIGTIWLVFFPPAVYRRWVANDVESPEQTADR